jgi:hypothetical protein
MSEAATEESGLTASVDPGVPAQPPRFSVALQDFARQSSHRPVSLGELLGATQDRGVDLLLLLISLPFATPIPLPGLSALFGLVILVVGAGLAVGRKPWLPEALLRRQFPARLGTSVLAAASRVVRWLEVLLRPRLHFLHEQRIYRRVAGLLIMLSGLLLLLPLPIPLTNSMPALTVVLLTAGAMERDGLFFLAGCAWFALTLAFFGLLAFGGAHLLRDLWPWT